MEYWSRCADLIICILSLMRILTALIGITLAGALIQSSQSTCSSLVFHLPIILGNLMFSKIKSTNQISKHKILDFSLKNPTLGSKV